MTDEHMMGQGGVVPTPKSRTSSNIGDMADSQEALTTSTMSVSRDAMKQMLTPEDAGINVSDLAQGQTQPKMVAASDNVNKETLKIFCYSCHQKLDVTYMEPFSHFECPSCKTDLIVPQWLDNFLLEEQVGIGGMAQVYRALDLTLDREVAIKILNPDLAVHAESRDMFLNEARMAANISSHAVVPIYTCGLFEGKAYIAMQYMPGRSLENVIREENGKTEIKDIVKWLKDVAEGLNTAMLSGVVHHDVKPGNLMLDFENRAKICDFGLSQAVGDTKVAASHGWVSPHYVSPEKIMTGFEDHRGDIYSLGAAFYHVFTGQTAFRGNTNEEIMQNRLDVLPIPPHEIRKDLPQEISELLMAMMAFTPEERPEYSQITEHISMFMMSTMKRKKSSLKKRPKTSSAQRPGGASQALANRKKSNPLVTLFNLLLVASLVGAAGFYTFESKFFAEPNRPIETVKKWLKMAPAGPQDHLKDVTAAFAAGDVKNAEMLAKIFLESGQTNVDAVKQAMLQMATAKFLRNTPNSAQAAAKIMDQLAGLGAPVDCVDHGLSFLCADGLSSDELVAKVAGDPHGEVLAANLILIKTIYDNTDEKATGVAVDALSNTSKKLTTPYWGNVWSTRLNRWRKAMKSGRYTDVEPVITGKKYITKKTEVAPAEESKMEVVSLPQETAKTEQPKKPVVKTEPKVKELNLAGVTDAVDFGSGGEAAADAEPAFEGVFKDVTASKLKAARAGLKRPQPEDFNLSDAMLNRYLKSVNKSARENEGLRGRRIMGLRDYLIHANNRTNIEVRRLKLKKGSVTVSRLTLTPDHIAVKVGSSNKKLAWNKLSVQQFAEFLEFFAKRKESIVSAGVMKREDMLKNIAMDYFNLAVFCDWYGDYAGAVKYGKKALSVDSRFETAVNKLFGL